ncbi:hypothetical protein GGR50DRAFT_8177 [Xylaria sp. CBS 124048]|nr:hypothetical protein GGR50DRAFT_8177 [Xylaria sp. CBS 124048]
MNWTEGNLARHSRGKQRNALIARQKQHFAKVRHNLLSGPSITTSPFPGPASASESPRRGLSARKRHDRSATPLQSSKPDANWRYPTRPPDDKNADLPTNLDRRKRLLRTSDWAGLGLQKPLDISFPGQIYAAKRWARVARTPERVSRETSKHVPGQRERPGHLKRSAMRIHIGGHEIQPSVITGSLPSARRYTSSLARSAHRSQPRPSASASNQHEGPAPGRQEHEHRNVTTNDIPPATSTPLGKIEAPVNVVYSSSVIHEPTPRRNGDFRVLQWTPSNSEDGGSMQVEVEQPTALVPASQESEQQRWEDWALCDSSSNLLSNTPLKVMGALDSNAEDSASSVLTLPSHLQIQLPILQLKNAARSSPRHSSSELVNAEEIFRKHNRSSEDNVSSSESIESLAPAGKHTIEKKSIPEDEDDLNDIWMKFACGDDENSDELLANAFKAAASQAAVELRPSDTSSSVNERTETSTTCGAAACSTDRRYKEDVVSIMPSESRVAVQGTTASETASSTFATVGSSDEPPRSAMRFVIPKAFVGKYVNTERAERPPSFIANIPKNGKGKGKRKRKVAMDGRTDIRNLPDFDGDPIEEIEDD